MVGLRGICRVSGTWWKRGPSRLGPDKMPGMAENPQRPGMLGIPALVSVAIAAAAFASYATTACRTITWWDGSSYPLAAYMLGVAPAPRSLILTLLGWLATRIPYRDPSLGARGPPGGSAGRVRGRIRGAHVRLRSDALELRRSVHTLRSKRVLHWADPARGARLVAPRGALGFGGEIVPSLPASRSRLQRPPDEQPAPARGACVGGLV